jgi:hypothetical protein
MMVLNVFVRQTYGCRNAGNPIRNSTDLLCREWSKGTKERAKAVEHIEVLPGMKHFEWCVVEKRRNVLDVRNIDSKFMQYHALTHSKELYRFLKSRGYELWRLASMANPSVCSTTWIASENGQAGCHYDRACAA